MMLNCGEDDDGQRRGALFRFKYERTNNITTGAQYSNFLAVQA
jgi:hypothetical protein